MLQCFTSEEVDVLGIESDTIMGEEDSPSLSPAYEELVEVITKAVDKLNIEWPADKRGVRFLPSIVSPPSRRLPFFLICTVSCLFHGKNLTHLPSAPKLMYIHILGG